MLLAQLKEGLSELGWKEGTQFVIEERWANGQLDQLQPLADELAKMRPAIILAWPSITVVYAARHRPTRQLCLQAPMQSDRES
jgi:hypothetical protein